MSDRHGFTGERNGFKICKFGHNRDRAYHNGNSGYDSTDTIVYKVMKMKLNKQTISGILVVLAIILVIVMTVWYLFGNSPTTDQLLMTYLLAPILFTFAVYEKLNDKVSNTREDVQKELSEIKIQLGRIEGRLNIKE